MISDDSDELLDFIVEKTIEVLSFICDVVVKSLKSYMQTINVLGR